MPQPKGVHSSKTPFSHLPRKRLSLLPTIRKRPLKSSPRSSMKSRESSTTAASHAGHRNPESPRKRPISGASGNGKRCKILKSTVLRPGVSSPAPGAGPRCPRRSLHCWTTIDATPGVPIVAGEVDLTSKTLKQAMDSGMVGGCAR